MAAAPKAQGGAPLPAKLAGLLREAKWLLVVAVAGYLLLILATHHGQDSGWSRQETGGAIRNAGGRIGAWLSDVLLSVFGWSAFWWVVLLLIVVVRGYRKLEPDAAVEPRPLWLPSLGFGVLLLGSAMLESLRLYGFAKGLPMDAGGILGAVLGKAGLALVGFTGATLLALAATGIGWSLFTGVSWLRMAELTGLLLETGWQLARGALEQRRDARLGE